MTNPTRYEIELRGRAGDRILRPVLDEFRVELTDAGTTRLIGAIRDPAHLHGLLTHFTAMNVELVSVRPLDTDPHHQEGTPS
ncbi:MAG: hypothetical protein AAFZ07_11060 [Actinomycetota bacterium]